MDYYDFYRFRKYVIAQSDDYRLILVSQHFVRYIEKILIREYCDHTGKWIEQIRVRFQPSEIQAIKEFL